MPCVWCVALSRMLKFGNRFNHILFFGMSSKFSRTFLQLGRGGMTTNYTSSGPILGWVNLNHDGAWLVKLVRKVFNDQL